MTKKSCFPSATEIGLLPIIFTHLPVELRVRERGADSVFTTVSPFWPYRYVVKIRPWDVLLRYRRIRLASARPMKVRTGDTCEITEIRTSTMKAGTTYA